MVHYLDRETTKAVFRCDRCMTPFRSSSTGIKDGWLEAEVAGWRHAMGYKASISIFETLCPEHAGG